MSNLSTSFGFSIRTSIALAWDGSRFFLSHSARRSLQLLAQIHRHCQIRSATHSVYWLLHCRAQIREIERRKCGGVLSLVVELTPDPRLRVLAIWLVGRCGGVAGTKRLAKFIGSTDFQTRKELARAFKRKHAWAEIRTLLRNEHDDRILLLVTSDRQQAFDARLRSYTKSTSVPSVNPPSKTTYLANGVDLNCGAPAKSRTLIRIILERIHRLVSLRTGL